MFYVVKGCIQHAPIVLRLRFERYIFFVTEWRGATRKRWKQIEHNQTLNQTLRRTWLYNTNTAVYNWSQKLAWNFKVGRWEPVKMQLHWRVFGVWNIKSHMEQKTLTLKWLMSSAWRALKTVYVYHNSL